MKPLDPNIEAQLGHLLSAFCDDRLDASHREQLEAILQDHPEARAYYLRYLDQHLELRRTGEVRSRSRQNVASLPRPGTTGRNTWMAVSGVAAVLILGLSIALWKSLSPQPDNLTVAVTEPPVPIAYLTRADGVKWRSKTNLPKIGGQLSAGAYELLAGQLRLDFIDGAAVAIQSPAEFSLQDEDSVLLKRGKMAVRASKPDGGFTVNTPVAIFFDVGTEFAVNVTEDSSSQLLVRDGEVVASVLGNEGTVLHGNSDSALSGETLVVDASQRTVQRAELSESQFAAMIDPGLIPLNLGPAYVNAVKASSPLGYWRFEKIEDGVIRNEMSSSHQALVFGDLSLEGLENRVGFFTPEKTDQYVLVEEGFEGLNRDGEYSIELWMNPLNHDFSAVVGLVQPDRPGRDKHHKRDRHKKKHRLELRLAQIQSLAMDSKRCSFSELYAEHAGRMHFFHRLDPDDPFKNVSHAFSVDPYSPGKWQHIVAVREADEISLFQNGALVYADTAPPNRDDDVYRVIVGRYSHKMRKKPGWMPNSFAGRIDEVAVYDRALSAEEVTAHFESVGR